MLFTSSEFIIFFLPLLFLIYFLVPKKFLGVRNFVLFAFSLIFYAWGGVKYLALFAVSMAANYLGGLGVGLAKSKNVKRLWLILTVGVGLGLLGVFKYAGFFTSTLAHTGLPVKVVSFVLPIGISFYTFQGLSYVIDVYRGDAALQKNPLKVCLYIALFPQLVAGPIVRYTTVEKELSSREHSVTLFSDGAVRFMLGFGKKMLMANPMGEVADRVFSHTGSELLTAPSAWVGIIAYAMQIYFDFSAYSDMAIGLGKMFGFRFNENFNYPYISRSITEFWRRWHISLSTWFRDYVYIPLGGNRCSVIRHIINLAIVWFLTGMWHGASWNFILWGVYYGVLLILEKYVFGGVTEKLPRALRHVLTLALILVGWVFFRADSFSSAVQYLSAMAGANGTSPHEAVYLIMQYLPEFIICFIGIFPVKRLLEKKFSANAEHSLSAAFFKEFAPKLFALGVFALAYMKLVSGSFNPFIYFQF
ncbi:MAG: MBOAT family protein [Clostridia bacterium]|nr:MBOAT family protein [Clostridia bacterium]